MNTSTGASDFTREAARRLDDLVGHWHTSGHVVTDGTPISGTDTYEWLPGGNHVAHYVDVVVGEKPLRALEILSCDPGTGGVVARAFDDAGTIEIMTATVDAEGTWCFRGGAEVAAVAAPADGARAEVRSILRVDRAGGQMSAKWQRSGSEGWVDWMDMRFTLGSDERVPFEQGEPAASMRALAPLIGTWSWASRDMGGEFELVGRTSFEWLPGGHFLIARGVLTFDGVTSHHLAVVRADSGRYAAQYFDDAVGNGEYTLKLHTDGRFDIDSARYRFRGRFDRTGDVIRGTWEQRPGDEWSYWFDAELRRLSADLAGAYDSDEAAVRRVIEEWARAVRRKDMPGVLRHHAPGIVLFDVPQPFQSQGLAAYAKTWDLFFAWTQDPVIYDITTMDVVAGGDVAFVVATLRCNGHEPDGTDLELDFRLTVGLRKVAGQWTVVHEHHSIPADPAPATQEDT